MQKMTAVTTQGTNASRSGSEVDKKFLEIYNSEFVTKRTLPKLETLSKDDIVLM